MRFRKLDLNLLVSLNALLAERSITRAAEQLHVTQSGMSNALARLREYFGDELLVQVGRRMEMTPLALRLQPEVRGLLARVDATLTLAADFDPATSDRQFVLQVSDYSLQTVVPHLLALAAREGPRVRFELVPLDDQRLLDRGEIDLLIMPRAHGHPEHPVETLLFEDMTCVLWRESPLAQGPLTLERYMDAAHVVVRPASGLPPVFDGWFTESLGRTRRVEVTSYSLASLPHLVAGTERIATIHARVARRMAAALPVVLRPVPLPMPRLELVMQWPQSRQDHGALRWLRDLLKRSVQALDASLPPAEQG